MDNNNPKFHQTIDTIINDLCSKHSSENIEADVIALFEDIIRFFSGREEEFVNFESMPMDQKEQIYNEIMTIINLLRKLGTSIDREEAIGIMSKDLISSFTKRNKKKHAIKEKLDAKEQTRLKKEFSTLTLQELHKSRQQHIKQQEEISTSKLNLPGLEKQVKELMKSGVKFSDKVKRANQISKGPKGRFLS